MDTKKISSIFVVLAVAYFLAMPIMTTAGGSNNNNNNSTATASNSTPPATPVPPSPPITGAATDIEVVDSEIVKRNLRLFIGNAHLTNYTLYADGRAIYEFDYGGRPTDRGLQRIGNITEIEVHTNHTYTAENGYRFENDNGVVYTPEGKRLIIETTAPPPS